jgi:hypothetical protein
MDTLETFGQRNFGTLDLGDARRTRRLVESVDLMCRRPGGTLPTKLNRPADLRGFYRVMNRPEAKHEVIMAGHTEYTRQCIADVGAATVVLNLQDATELDYTTKTELAQEMGQIGQGTHRGYICHNSLAVRADTGAVLGLTSQILHHRAEVPKNETVKACRERQDRESRLWVQAAQASGPAPAGVTCVDVSDSLSDTFEYMAYEVSQGRCFLLRQRENRRLEQPLADEDYLEPAVRALPAQGQRELRVQAAPGRKARDTTVQVAFAPVCLAVPGKAHGQYAKQPLEVWAVRVWEEHTPVNEKPLEWILLTNVPVHHLAQAHERVEWYEKRWIIEEYHKGMKTGCNIESLQFDQIESQEPAIAVLSVVATTLLQLRDAARAPDADQRRASEIISETYIEVLVAHYAHRLGPDPSIREFYMHVARLGGHQNRKVDGLPGWITLWRGWERLQAMVDGYHARLRKTKNKCGTN